MMVALHARSVVEARPGGRCRGKIEWAASTSRRMASWTRRDVIGGVGVGSLGFLTGCTDGGTQENPDTESPAGTRDPERQIRVESTVAQPVQLAIIVRNTYHGQIFRFSPIVSSDKPVTSRGFEGRPVEIELRLAETNDWKEFDYTASCVADIHITVEGRDRVSLKFPCP